MSKSFEVFQESTIKAEDFLAELDEKIKRINMKLAKFEFSELETQKIAKKLEKEK